MSSSTPSPFEAADRLLAAQTPDGALPMGPWPAAAGAALHVIPYFGNLAAVGLVAAARDAGAGTPRRGRCLGAARRWAEWYDARRNPDGTAYDQTRTAGSDAWQSTGHYDSTDSYAATYLELLAALHRAAPDAAWLRGRYAFIRRSVAAMRLTRQPSGLTTATPKWPVMYTMDNVEVLRGLRASVYLARTAGAESDGRAWDALAAATAIGIARNLWDARAGTFLVGLQTDGGRMTAAKGAWYPDVMANLMAVGWLPDTPGWGARERAALYARLAARFGGSLPAAARTEDDLEHLLWWGYAARTAGDSRRFAGIRNALGMADLSAAVNPANLGHICRLLSSAPISE